MRGGRGVIRVHVLLRHAALIVAACICTPCICVAIEQPGALVTRTCRPLPTPAPSPRRNPALSPDGRSHWWRSAASSTPSTCADDRYPWRIGRCSECSRGYCGSAGRTQASASVSTSLVVCSRSVYDVPSIAEADPPPRPRLPAISSVPSPPRPFLCALLSLPFGGGAVPTSSASGSLNITCRTGLAFPGLLLRPLADEGFLSLFLPRFKTPGLGVAGAAT